MNIMESIKQQGLAATCVATVKALAERVDDHGVLYLSQHETDDLCLLAAAIEDLGGRGIMTLTNIEIARHAAYLAKSVANSAGDFLVLPEDAHLPVDDRDLARFVGRLRGLADWIERTHKASEDTAAAPSGHDAEHHHSDDVIEAARSLRNALIEDGPFIEPENWRDVLKQKHPSVWALADRGMSGETKPIIFSGPMVRALLDGRKTQTRRVLRPKADAFESPKFSNGDLLWVREGFALLPRSAYRASVRAGTIEQREHPTDEYSAAVFREGFDRSGPPRWRPSIHMPRWASRITLRVTGVRVQRVQEISGDDAVAEGICFADGRQLLNCYGPECPTDHARSCNLHGCWGCREDFRDLWDSINAKRVYSWDSNPWVAAYTFEVIRKNVDEVTA